MQKMVLALLDELPCIINEADELMARVSQLAATFQPGKEDEDCDVGLDRSASLARSSPSDQSDQSESTTTHSESSADEQRQSSGSLSTSTPAPIDNLDATIKFFGKHFLLSQPVPVDKLKAALPPPESSQRESLRALASRGYHLMKRVHHCQQNAWETLTRHLEETSSLTFDNHRRIAELLLGAVVRYVKLNLLWSSVAPIPGLLSLHGFFQHLQASDQQRELEPSSAARDSPNLFSQLDHTDHRVREFVLCFGTSALLKIQQDFAQHPRSATLASALVALLRSSLPRWLRCHDLTELRNRGVFDLDTLYHAGNYASHPAFLDIADTASVPEWVLYVALCVPHYLKVSPDLALKGSDGSSGANGDVAINVTLWEAVQVVLGDRLMLVVHRDHTVNAHGLLFQQVVSCTATAMASSVSSVGQTPPPPPAKKELVAFGKQTLLSCGERRHQRREVVLHLLATSVKLLKHNAALAGPLLPMLTATLTLATVEIDWLLAHDVSISSGPSTAAMPSLLPSFLKPKHWHRARFPDHSSELCTLLARTHHLRELLSRSLGFVTPYYRAFLASGDADAIAYAVQTFINQQSESGIDSRVVELLQSFQDRNRYRLEPEAGQGGRRHSNPATGGSNESSWVREWQQTAAYFATTRVQLPVELRSRIDLACKHAEYARADVDNLLERVASFSKVWWFRRGVERCFSSPSGTSVAIIDLFGRFLSDEYAISERLDHDKDEEESLRLKAELQRLVERLNGAVVHHLAVAVDRVVVKRTACASASTSHHTHQSAQGEKNPAPVAPTLRSHPQLSGEEAILPLMRLPRRPSLVSAANVSAFAAGMTHNRRDSKHNSGSGNVDDGDALVFQLASSICELSELNPALVSRIARQAIEKCAIQLLQRIAIVDRTTTSGQGKGKRLNHVTISLSQSFEAANATWQCLRQTARRLFHGVVDCEALLSEILARESRSSAPYAADGTAKTQLALALNQQAIHTATTLVDKLTCFFVELVTHKCLPRHGSSGSCGSSSSSSKRETPVLVASPKLQRFLYASPSDGPTPPDIHPREYTSPAAIGSLLQLIGRDGVQVVVVTLVELLSEQIQALRLSLEVEEVPLMRIDQTLASCTSDREVADAAKQLPSADELASQLTRIGVTAFLLQLLDRALGAGGAWEVLLHRACFSSFDALSRSKSSTWRLLPAAFAAVFTARAWSSARLVPAAAAADSNVHMAGVAMALLLRQSLAQRSKEDAEDHVPCGSTGETVAARHVGRVIRSCALVVLAMELQAAPLQLQLEQPPVGRARAIALEIAVQEPSY